MEPSSLGLLGGTLAYVAEWAYRRDLSSAVGWVLVAGTAKLCWDDHKLAASLALLPIYVGLVAVAWVIALPGRLKTQRRQFRQIVVALGVDQEPFSFSRDLMMELLPR